MNNYVSFFILRAALSFSLIIFTSQLLAESQLEEEWKLVKNRNEIKVYMKHTEDSKLKTFKGVTVFSVDEPLKLATVVNDYEFLATLLHLISSLEEMERKSDIDRDLKIKTFLPWPVKNRDMAVNAIIRQDLESKNLFIDLDHIDDKYPIEKNYVRMPHMDAVLSIELLEDKKVRFTYQVILDPGGYIPSILVNLILKDIPYYTLRRMKRVLQSDAYTGVRETYIQYPEEW